MLVHRVKSCNNTDQQRFEVCQLHFWQNDRGLLGAIFERCQLHFWQNDRGLLHAIAVTRGLNRHQVKWIVQFVECRTCNRKVVGLIPARIAGLLGEILNNTDQQRFQCCKDNMLVH